MPSWQAKLVAAGTRLLIRREDWGDENRLARRARRLFGSVLLWRWFCSRGLRVTRVTEQVRGEWIVPPGAGNGVLLYLHGGGYVSCSPGTHRPITAALARLTGMGVFSLEYRLGPEHRFPAALDDAVAAYGWLLQRGVGPGAISFAGDSAGGGLALATAIRARDLGLPRPASIVCFSPWTDLTGAGESVKCNDGRCAMFRPANMEQFASAYLGGASPLEPYASPVIADLHNLCPVLLQVSSTELLLDDSRRLHERVQQAGGTSELQIYDDVIHCWQMLDGIMPEARDALKKAAEFICRHTSVAQCFPKASLQARD